MQKEIKAQRERLKQVKNRESSILSDIEQTNKQMKTVENDLRKYKIRLANTEGRISQVEHEISVSKSTLERHRQWMKRKLRTIHKYGRNSDVILLLLSAHDISQLIRTGKNLQYITAHEHTRMITYQKNLNSLNEKEKQLTLLKKEIVSNRAKVLAEETSLAAKRRDKEIVLASVKKKKSSHTKMIREMEESSKKLLDIIKRSDRGDAFAGRGFAALKGRLPWPVEGKVVIPYGSQKDPQFNTPVFRSGAFIESRSDSPAKAVHEGKVVFAEWFKGYGQLVIINHGEGYHSLYGSLSEIFTKVGDIIKDKQIVGRVGNSGLVNLPGLYFELRYKGKPINPTQWLQRR
ncbi:MAG TPA: peptidoglycan DD-metalloendopeptidase family protein [Thermodesulfovibrionales bacterium]|jgi:septal ring factor EnvC (AmiA/AmiB activator)|nr:peptidoglycan DD-metalloendopeptidase family protein [Thermodesulfovibrionales bacterium]